MFEARACPNRRIGSPFPPSICADLDLQTAIPNMSPTITSACVNVYPSHHNQASNSTSTDPFLEKNKGSSPSGVNPIVKFVVCGHGCGVQLDSEVSSGKEWRTIETNQEYLDCLVRGDLLEFKVSEDSRMADIESSQQHRLQQCCCLHGRFLGLPVVHH